MYNFRTDLALERREMLEKLNKKEIEGIEVEEKERSEKVKISKVKVKNKEGEQAIGKPMGTYVTIDIKKLKIATEDEIEEAANTLAEELKELVNIHIDSAEDVLVVGLGNEYVTPDSLGPKVIANIEVTRHVIKYLPEYVEEGTRPISAISPGVLGTTGIETLEILEGIVNNVKPKMLIVIDALASRSIERISSTIQLSDTGIVPGAGVGNTRKELSIDTLGIPVIALGVPTVVESAVMVNESLDLFIKKLQDEARSNDYLNELKEKDNYEEIKEALNPGNYNMIVTPKEIDELIDNMKEIVSRRNKLCIIKVKDNEKMN